MHPCLFLSLYFALRGSSFQMFLSFLYLCLTVRGGTGLLRESGSWFWHPHSRMAFIALLKGQCIRILQIVNLSIHQSIQQCNKLINTAHTGLILIPSVALYCTVCAYHYMIFRVFWPRKSTAQYTQMCWTHFSCVGLKIWQHQIKKAERRISLEERGLFGFYNMALFIIIIWCFDSNES